MIWNTPVTLLLAVAALPEAGAATNITHSYLRAALSENEGRRNLRFREDECREQRALQSAGDPAKTVSSFDDLKREVESCGCTCFVNETLLGIDPVENITFSTDIDINLACSLVFLVGNDTTNSDGDVLLPALVMSNGGIRTSSLPPTDSGTMLSLEKIGVIGTSALSILRASLTIEWCTFEDDASSSTSEYGYDGTQARISVSGPESSVHVENSAFHRSLSEPVPACVNFNILDRIDSLTVTDTFFIENVDEAICIAGAGTKVVARNTLFKFDYTGFARQIEVEYESQANEMNTLLTGGSIFYFQVDALDGNYLRNATLEPADSNIMIESNLELGQVYPQGIFSTYSQVRLPDFVTFESQEPACIKDVRVLKADEVLVHVEMELFKNCEHVCLLAPGQSRSCENYALPNFVYDEAKSCLLISSAFSSDLTISLNDVFCDRLVATQAPSDIRLRVDLEPAFMSPNDVAIVYGRDILNNGTEEVLMVDPQDTNITVSIGTGELPPETIRVSAPSGPDGACLKGVAIERLDDENWINIPMAEFSQCSASCNLVYDPVRECLNLSEEPGNYNSIMIDMTRDGCSRFTTTLAGDDQDAFLCIQTRTVNSTEEIISLIDELNNNDFSTLRLQVLDLVDRNETLGLSEPLVVQGTRTLEMEYTGSWFGNRALTAEQGVERLFVVEGGAFLTLDGFILNGGGIENRGGTVVVEDTTILRATSQTSGGAILNTNGGDLEVVGTMIERSFSALDGGGIATLEGSTTLVISSSFIANTAMGRGQAILNCADCETEIHESTFEGTNFIFNAPGGKVIISGRLSLRNAGNLAGPGSDTNFTFEDIGRLVATENPEWCVDSDDSEPLMNISSTNECKKSCEPEDPSAELCIAVAFDTETKECFLCQQEPCRFNCTDTMTIFAPAERFQFAPVRLPDFLEGEVCLAQAEQLDESVHLPLVPGNLRECKEVCGYFALCEYFTYDNQTSTCSLFVDGDIIQDTTDDVQCQQGEVYIKYETTVTGFTRTSKEGCFQSNSTQLAEFLVPQGDDGAAQCRSLCLVNKLCRGFRQSSSSNTTTSCELYSDIFFNETCTDDGGEVFIEIQRDVFPKGVYIPFLSPWDESDGTVVLANETNRLYSKEACHRLCDATADCLAVAFIDTQEERCVTFTQEQISLALDKVETLEPPSSLELSFCIGTIGFDETLEEDTTSTLNACEVLPAVSGVQSSPSGDLLSVESCSTICFHVGECDFFVYGFDNKTCNFFVDFDVMSDCPFQQTITLENNDSRETVLSLGNRQNRAKNFFQDREKLVLETEMIIYQFPESVDPEDALELCKGLCNVHRGCIALTLNNGTMSDLYKCVLFEEWLILGSADANISFGKFFEVFYLALDNAQDRDRFLPTPEGTCPLSLVDGFTEPEGCRITPSPTAAPEFLSPMPTCTDSSSKSKSKSWKKRGKNRGMIRSGKKGKTMSSRENGEMLCSGNQGKSSSKKGAMKMKKSRSFGKQGKGKSSSKGDKMGMKSKSSSKGGKMGMKSKSSGKQGKSSSKGSKMQMKSRSLRVHDKTNEGITLFSFEPFGLENESLTDVTDNSTLLTFATEDQCVRFCTTFDEGNCDAYLWNGAECALQESACFVDCDTPLAALSIEFLDYFYNTDTTSTKKESSTVRIIEDFSDQRSCQALCSLYNDCGAIIFQPNTSSCTLLTNCNRTDVENLEQDGGYDCLKAELEYKFFPTANFCIDESICPLKKIESVRRVEHCMAYCDGFWGCSMIVYNMIRQECDLYNEGVGQPLLFSANQTECLEGELLLNSKYVPRIPYLELPVDEFGGLCLGAEIRETKEARGIQACFKLCEDSQCEGFAYNDVTKNCSLYGDDVLTSELLSNCTDADESQFLMNVNVVPFESSPGKSRANLLPDDTEVELGNLNECAILCESFPGCSSFTYSSGNGGCRLVETESEAFDDPDTILYDSGDYRMFLAETGQIPNGTSLTSAILVENERDCLRFCSLLPNCEAVVRDASGRCTLSDSATLVDDLGTNLRVWVRNTTLDELFPVGVTFNNTLVPITSQTTRRALSKLRNKMSALERTAAPLIDKLGKAGDSITRVTDTLDTFLDPFESLEGDLSKVLDILKPVNTALKVASQVKQIKPFVRLLSKPLKAATSAFKKGRKIIRAGGNGVEAVLTPLFVIEEAIFALANFLDIFAPGQFLIELQNLLSTLLECAEEQGNKIAGSILTNVANVIDKALSALISLLDDIQSLCEDLERRLDALLDAVKTDFVNRLKDFADILGKVLSVFESEPFKSLFNVIDRPLIVLPKIEIGTQRVTFDLVIKSFTITLPKISLSGRLCLPFAGGIICDIIRGGLDFLADAAGVVLKIFCLGLCNPPKIDIAGIIEAVLRPILAPIGLSPDIDLDKCLACVVISNGPSTTLTIRDLINYVGTAFEAIRKIPILGFLLDLLDELIEEVLDAIGISKLFPDFGLNVVDLDLDFGKIIDLDFLADAKETLEDRVRDIIAAPFDVVRNFADEAASLVDELPCDFGDYITSALFSTASPVRLRHLQAGQGTYSEFDSITRVSEAWLSAFTETLQTYSGAPTKKFVKKKAEAKKEENALSQGLTRPQAFPIRNSWLVDPRYLVDSTQSDFNRAGVGSYLVIAPSPNKINQGKQQEQDKEEFLILYYLTTPEDDVVNGLICVNEVDDNGGVSPFTGGERSFSPGDVARMVTTGSFSSDPVYRVRIDFPVNRWDRQDGKFLVSPGKSGAASFGLVQDLKLVVVPKDKIPANRNIVTNCVGCMRGAGCIDVGTEAASSISFPESSSVSQTVGVQGGAGQSRSYLALFGSEKSRPLFYDSATFGFFLSQGFLGRFVGQSGCGSWLTATTQFRRLISNTYIPDNIFTIPPPELLVECEKSFSISRTGRVDDENGVTAGGIPWASSGPNAGASVELFGCAGGVHRFVSNNRIASSDVEHIIERSTLVNGKQYPLVDFVMAWGQWNGDNGSLQQTLGGAIAGRAVDEKRALYGSRVMDCVKELLKGIEQNTGSVGQSCDASAWQGTSCGQALAEIATRLGQ